MRLNRERIETKFKDIQKAIERLSRFAEIKKEEFLANDDFIHVARSHLLTAAEASIGICLHIAAKKLKQAVAEYASCFELLQKHNLISNELAGYMVKLIGLRNRMVHRYEEIDYGFLFDNFQDIIKNLQRIMEEVSNLLLAEEKEQS
jgi:uncharacterized protein YutE (UPF0331/DUF86 family)